MTRRASLRMVGGAVLVVLLAAGATRAERPALRVGSKSFTESYILAEIVAQVIDDTGEARAERRLGLGGTGLAWGALAAGAIDIYPEYTGTIAQAILKEPTLTSLDAIRAGLDARGVIVSAPLGFANTYALAVRRDLSVRLGLRAISDLARHPGLRAAFDAGFLERADGWPGLQRHYGLRFAEVRTMEHALTYPALAADRVDVIDVFSTDGQLARLDLVLLADDGHFFPDYTAVLLARRELAAQYPKTWVALQRLSGRIDSATMSGLNALADLEHRSFAEAAATFLGRSNAQAPRRHAEIAMLTLEHLQLVVVSLTAAIVIGLPLGILAARRRRVAQAELMGVGVIQTIPALALLSFMIPLFGIGQVPALVALSLYALLPIVRTTHAGISTLDPRLTEMTTVLGLRGWRRLAWIELPLASVTIMAGIKTAAVVTVGTATLAAFIGGGGYGTLIVTGLALNDVRTILAGAIPAAVMALVIHGAFELLDRLVVPRALRSAEAAAR